MSAYEGKEWLSTREAAEYLRVTPDTIRRWHRDGTLRGTGMTTQHRIYKLSDIRQLLEENKYPELDRARKELGIDG